jgi:phage gp46-like protein
MLLSTPLLSTPLLAPPFPPLPPLPVFPPLEEIVATDIADLWNPFLGGADFQVVGQILATNQDLVTAVTISLFTNRRADASDILPVPNSIDRGGWWGSTYLQTDPLAGFPLGSRLWLLSRSISNTQLLITAQGYCQEALAWIKNRGIARTITVTTSFLNGDQSKLKIAIEIIKPNGQAVNWSYNWAWNQVAVS